jgi:hypothetical protein
MLNVRKAEAKLKREQQAAAEEAEKLQKRAENKPTGAEIASNYFDFHWSHRGNSIACSLPAQSQLLSLQIL